jgi:hypothetical protein
MEGTMFGSGPGGDIIKDTRITVLSEENSRLLNEKLALESEVRALKLQLEKAGVDPDYAKRVQESLAQRTQEVRLSEEKIGSLQKTIEGLVEKTKEHQTAAEKAKLITDGLQAPIKSLMLETLDEKEKEGRLRNYAVAFVLGCAASLAASWIYAYL